MGRRALQSSSIGRATVPELAIVFDNQQVTPGTTVSGSVFVNYEGSARSLSISLVDRADHGMSGIADRTVQTRCIQIADGLQAGQRFPFSFALPLDASPLFRGEPLGLTFGNQRTATRMWGVSAQIDRPGFDPKAFAGLFVQPSPPEVPVMAMVLPHEIEQMQNDPARGTNSKQLSLPWFARGSEVNPADGVSIRCDPPAARQGQALMVDVHVPVGFGSDFSVGLFLYEQYWVGSDGGGSTEKFREVWSAAQPVSVEGESRLILRVPSDQAPTHQGKRVSTWWDVRPCFGGGTSGPSQRISQPVIIRP